MSMPGGAGACFRLGTLATIQKAGAGPRRSTKPMEEEIWLPPEPLMISKQSERGWKNCAVSARGQML
jgi:hypothetical protein